MKLDEQDKAKALKIEVVNSIPNLRKENEE
jgi:hypothetical protein